MPFRSRAQLAKFRVLEAHGQLPAGTTERWLAETGRPEKLPKRAAPAGVRERRSNRAPAFPSVRREARRRGR